MSEESEYHPRLCTIRKWPDFTGYGFNLHAEKGRAGQYIGKVDADSPAEAAGMREGDRIVEVEGVNIGNENHSQVVERIKKAGESVTMLLVDPDTDNYFKEQKTVVSSSMSEVIRMSTPPGKGAEEPEPDPEPEIPEPEPEPPFEPEPEPFGVRAGVGNPDEPEPEPEPVGVRAGVGNPDEPEPEPEPEAHFGRAQVGEPDEPEPEPEPEVRAVLPDEPEPEPEPEVRAVLPDEPEPEPEPGVKSAHDYHPRLCHLIKRADFNGYGFNLHGEKDVQGQYIGLVDDNSPAERAGLKKGDRIIEVNGENTESSSHQQVIMQIKSGGDETKLLVVDKVTDDYYKNNGLEIKASLPEVVYKSSETKDTTEMTYTPRSCHIIKWPDFNGYGFNLHAEKERGGQYIGKIDDNSPAQDAGLKERDRIIEVNGVNVEDMTHREVITKIKEGGDETRLLVVDPAADSYYKSRGVTVSSTMQGVKFLQTSRRSPAVSGVTNGESRPARTEPVQNSAPAVQANGGGDFLSMNLSAKEMRERIASKKKADPKQRSNMDFKTKYDMFQKL